MPKYHTGYYLQIGRDVFSPQEFSEKFINESYLKLIKSNYLGLDWKIEWIYNNYWNGLEFIINSESFEVAQNVLYLVLCSSAVIDSTVLWSNEAHYPHEFGTINNEKGIDLLKKPVTGHSSHSIPSYFYLAAQASKDHKLSNSIVKYQLSTEIYSQHDMDLHEVIDWKTTEFNFIQMRFAYAIIVAYSVIEELGLDVKVTISKNKRSILDNGEWNPEVHDDLVKRLSEANIDIDEDIAWMIRGDATEIEKRRPIKTSKPAEWSDPPDWKNDFFIRISDGYVYLPDAINYISYLRSSISSHAVGNRIMNLSVFDVANAQHLARRLILEKLGLWLS
jgi:hypothetical protein